MNRWAAKPKRDARREAVCTVLATRFALAQVETLDQERVRVAKSSRVAICSGRRAGEECTFWQQLTESFDLAARKTPSAVHGRAVSQRFVPCLLDTP
ncbi:MAG: hypothetical protein ACJA14_002794, partial [Ilumatobacter sp.]